jgi:cell division protein FtsI (penicillin-binding protein 3)
MDTRSRLSIAGAFCLLPVAPLSARLAQLQVMQHGALESRANGALKHSIREAVPRADILDRNGNVLAHSVPTWDCFIDKAMVKDPAPIASRLAKLLGASPQDILRKARGRGRFAWAAMGLDFERWQAVSQARIEGVGLVASQERFYPNGDMARGVLGAVGTEHTGLSGVELAFESRLQGSARKVEYIRDGAGRKIYESGGASKQDEKPLQLTLDRNIQYYASEILRETAAKYSIRSGLLAVQDPNTGEILAMASYPENPLRNPLIQDTYEPGSTFKVVTLAAALEDAVVPLTEKIFCENGKFDIVPGVAISDHDPRGDLDMRGILQHSSNIGMAKIAERVGAARFYRMSRAFGFANRTGLALPGETAGEIKPLSDLTKVALAASSYGYGVGVSALQMLSAYSAIANGGTLYEPSIVSDGRKPSRVRRVASQRTIAALQEMLENVVESGTGLAARIQGYRVAGKTGTSRKLDRKSGKYSQSQYVASFAGFLPASRPQWTILVVIDEPKGSYYGSMVAAPIFANLGQLLLTLKGVPPDHALAKAGPSPR